MQSKLFQIYIFHTIIFMSHITIMIDSRAVGKIQDTAFNNSDHLHQRYSSEGQPTEITIKHRPIYH